jgi:hypothetical protein
MAVEAVLPAPDRPREIVNGQPRNQAGRTWIYFSQHPVCHAYRQQLHIQNGGEPRRIR